MNIYHPSDQLRWNQVKILLEGKGVTITETRPGTFKLRKDPHQAFTTPDGNRFTTLEAYDNDGPVFTRIIETQFMITFGCEVIPPVLE